MLLLTLLLLKPAASLLCMRSGAPGGLFTPSLTLGALLGAVLGHACLVSGPVFPPDCLRHSVWRYAGEIIHKPHLNRRSNDGVVWSLPIVCFASATGSLYSNTGCADDRTSINLRRPPDR